MVRTIGYLVIGVSLVLGAVAATTAYVPPLTADDSALAAGGGYAHLNAPAGVQRDAAGELVLSAAGARVPLVPAGTELTPDVQARLRAAGVRRVRVREFAFGRWQHAWLFVLAVAGLVAGSVLVRRETARAQLARPAGGERQPRGAPQTALAEIIAAARGLQADLPALAADADRTPRHHRARGPRAGRAGAAGGRRPGRVGGRARHGGLRGADGRVQPPRTGVEPRLVGGRGRRARRGAALHRRSGRAGAGSRAQAGDAAPARARRTRRRRRPCGALRWSRPC